MGCAGGGVGWGGRRGGGGGGARLSPPPSPSLLLHPNTYRDSFRCRVLPRYSLPTLTRIVQDAATPATRVVTIMQQHAGEDCVLGAAATSVKNMSR